MQIVSTERPYRDMDVYHSRDIQEINETFERLGEVPAWKEFVEAKVARAKEIRQVSSVICVSLLYSFALSIAYCVKDGKHARQHLVQRN